MSQWHAHQADACAQGTTVSGTLSARWDAGGGAREDTVEASAGVQAGQPSSHEMECFGAPTQP